MSKTIADFLVETLSDAGVQHIWGVTGDSLNGININLHHNAQQKGEVLSNQDLSASFQAAVMDILMAKTKKALEKYPVKTLVVAGGVAANQGLRERLVAEIQDVKVIIPPLRLCGDNAGMIAYTSVNK